MSQFEIQIAQLLNQEHIIFSQEKTYSDLRGGKFRYDFYLPYYDGGILIEVDGQQHWHPIYGAAALKKSQGHDRQKNAYALAHDIPLYRIPYWELSAIHSISDIITEKHRVRSRYHNDDLHPPT